MDTVRRKFSLPAPSTNFIKELRRDEREDPVNDTGWHTEHAQQSGSCGAGDFGQLYPFFAGDRSYAGILVGVERETSSPHKRSLA